MLNERISSIAKIIHSEVKVKDKKFPYGKALEIAHKVEGFKSSNYKGAASEVKTPVVESNAPEKWLMITDWENSGISWSILSSEEEGIKILLSDLNVGFTVNQAGELQYDKLEYEQRLDEATKCDLWHLTLERIS